MARTIAKIAVAKAIYAIDKPYDYVVPTELLPTLQVGMRVLVPFGQGNRGSEGMVLSIGPEATFTQKLKLISTQLDEAPVLDAEGIKLAIWMRGRYFCTLHDCIRAMLPTGLFFALKDSLVLQVTPELARQNAGTHANAITLVELLDGLGGTCDMEEIRRAFGTKNPNTAIKLLVDTKTITIESSAQRGIGDKSDKIATLAVDSAEGLAQVDKTKRRYPTRYAVIEFLVQNGGATVKEICYYTGASTSTVKSLEKGGLITLTKQEVMRRPTIEGVTKAPVPTLNEEQETVVHGLESLGGGDTAAAALLYGVTGSGKTQIYIRLIHTLLKQGKTAMVLVPEIVLTPQLLRIFTAQFGDSIAILHSSLRVGERFDEWKRVKRGEATVVLGTRSAVFAPLQNIGAIILDEEQEMSYKSENTPRYHAREVAKFRCVENNCLLLLGSATPSIESMYFAKTGKYHLFELRKRFNQGELPEVTIIDMKEELRRGNSSSVSGRLVEEISRNIQKGEQSILFLNRRGSNRLVSCGECGEVPDCPNCSVRLTYHAANGRLMCHYCGHSKPLPPECPSCGGLLNFVGIGTQQVQDDLEEIFTQHEILRMDSDTISAAHPHEEMLSKFQHKNIPVLVGTQMVAKGLDFENVTLVGVISADLSLFSQDIWAAERTFSLITQVVGRAGRGGKVGRAIIQTYTPQNEVVLCAARQDYDSFYEQEISQRSQTGHPPFSEVIVIFASGENENAVIRLLQRYRGGLVEGLHRINQSPLILGPAPAPVTKMKQRYRHQITLLATPTAPLRELLAHLLVAAQQDKEARGVSVYIDRQLH